MDNTMKWKTNGKRLFAFLLAAVLMVSLCPLTVSAEGTCSHHQEHTDSCGYVEASACTHVCTDGTCNYRAAVPAAECDKGCTDTDEDGQIDHIDGCAYNAGTAEVPCDHEHNGECSYVKGHDCEYQCNICAVQAMIDALPEKQNITADNAADVKARIAAIDASGVELMNMILDKYTAAKEALGSIANSSVTPVKEKEKEIPSVYTVTYKDGMNGTVFEDDVHSGLTEGSATPAFKNGTPTRTGYTFDGWTPTVATTVTDDAVYTATWKPDKPSQLETVFASNAVYVKCSRGCAGRSMGFCEDSYQIGEVAGNAEDGYTCTVTVNAEKYVQAYGTMENTSHTLAKGEDGSKEFTLKFVDDQWTADRAYGHGFVDFQVECTTPETGYPAYFFIRTDNKILNDPNIGYSPDEYVPVPTGKGRTDWTAIDNALREQKPCDTAEAIAANLLNQPTIAQIVSQLTANNISFNQEKDLINWYVIKLDGHNAQWHVDGSIVYRWWLKYDANGGNGPVPEDSLHANGERVDVSFASNPTRSGYTFLGWSEDKDDTTATYTADGTKTITMPNRNVILYAVWKQNSYTVSYQVTGDVPEGYAAPGSTTVLDGGSHTVAAVPQSQTGTYEGKEGAFTFAGWTKDGLPASGEISDIHDDIKLEGVWKFTPADWGKLTIKKSADREKVRPGKTLKYTITVANNTGMDLEDVVVSDKLATTYLTFKEASAVSGQEIVYNTNTGELTWTIPELKDGGTAKLTITATVKSGVKDGTVIRNTAVITEAGGKSFTDKPSDSYDVKVSNKISILPETGDTSNIGLWIGVLLAAAVALGVVFIVMMKKKKTR